MMTPEQVFDVADRVNFDLIPANGQVAWDAATLTEGICEPDDLDAASYKKIATILDRDWGVAVSVVNTLYFRQPEDVSDPEVAKRYLPRYGLPAAGLRVQRGEDDPFAVLRATGSALRAATALPRAAQRLADGVKSGKITEATRSEIVDAARARATDVITPEIEAPMRQMLPS